MQNELRLNRLALNIKKCVPNTHVINHILLIIDKYLPVCKHRKAPARALISLKFYVTENLSKNWIIPSTFLCFPYRKQDEGLHHIQSLKSLFLQCSIMFNLWPRSFDAWDAVLRVSRFCSLSTFTLSSDSPA